MSTLALEEAQLPIAADDFNALEQRVLRMVELLKHERETRTAAEHRVQALENTVRSLEDSGLNSEQRAENLQETLSGTQEKLSHAENRIHELTAQAAQNDEQIQTLEREREAVRGRVERLLKHLEEIPA